MCLLKNIFLYKFVRAAESILALLILHIIRVGEEVEGVVVLLGLDGLALQLIALIPLKGGDILKVSPVPILYPTVPGITLGGKVEIFTSQGNLFPLWSPAVNYFSFCLIYFPYSTYTIS